MGKNKKDSVAATAMVKQTKYRFLTIFVCVFLSLVAVLTVTLGTISAHKSRNAVAKYNGQTMDTEVASFFASYYKYRFMSALSASGVVGVEDSPGFWNKKGDDGETYGDQLRAGVEEYIKQVLVANYLYDNYTNLTSTDRKKISEACEELLTYRANGKKDEFNKLVSDYGFSYSSLCEASMMLYKASMAERVIYGVDGSNVKNFPTLAESYLKKYSHVYLIFIRTESKFVYENGNRVMGDGGEYLTEPLTDEEKADREKVISEMRDAISALESGVGASMSEEMFFTYQAAHDEGDEDMYADGYYFHESSAFTYEFASALGEVVDKSLNMKVGEYGEVVLDFGVCFIYKDVPTTAAYASGLNEACFTDFYSDASAYLFNETVLSLSKDAKIKDKFFNIDIVNMPYNHEYLPKF
ncbi:MAG: hypothetical protein J6V09_01400 [Clostridia bacterium]|nr:hypothetical protein [Clostridia bacterium]